LYNPVRRHAPLDRTRQGRSGVTPSRPGLGTTPWSVVQVCLPHGRESGSRARSGPPAAPLRAPITAAAPRVRVGMESKEERAREKIGNRRIGSTSQFSGVRWTLCMPGPTLSVHTNSGFLTDRGRNGVEGQKKNLDDDTNVLANFLVAHRLTPSGKTQNGNAPDQASDGGKIGRPPNRPSTLHLMFWMVVATCLSQARNMSATSS
jgi:hypothetical protein